MKRSIQRQLAIYGLTPNVMLRDALLLTLLMGVGLAFLIF